MYCLIYIMSLFCRRVQRTEASFSFDRRINREWYRKGFFNQNGSCNEGGGRVYGKPTEHSGAHRVPSKKDHRAGVALLSIFFFPFCSSVSRGEEGEIVRMHTQNTEKHLSFVHSSYFSVAFFLVVREQTPFMYQCISEVVGWGGVDS